MTLLLRYLSCTNIINHTFSTLELASPGFVFLKKGCFVMSRFEVTIKDIDSNMDVALGVESVMLIIPTAQHGVSYEIMED